MRTHAQQATAFGAMGQDMTYALRRLRQRPAFAAAVIAVLALGIGATTALFSAVDAAMLRPLPFPHADRLVLPNRVFLPGMFRSNSYRLPTPADLAAMTDVFSHVATYTGGGVNLEDPVHPRRAQVGVVSPGFFQTMGVAPAIGRGFTMAEGKPGGPAVTVLSDAFWRRTFGGRPTLGRTVALGGTPYTVVGIMPPGFTFPMRSDLWIPLADPWAATQYSALSFGNTGVQTIARLAGGVSIDAAAARIESMWQRAGASIVPADSSARRGFQRQMAEFRAQGFAQPLRQTLVGDRTTPLLVLFGATTLLLLIACANVTNLLFAQAAMRRREIAVRAVLGATRPRIVRQLLTESLLLAMSGTALGVLLAPLLLHVVNTLMPPRLAGLSPASIDWRVVTFAAALAMVTGIGFGLWPALGAARAELGETLKGGGGHGATAGGARRARRLLLGGELALSVALLVGAGLMLRSFARIMGVDSGVRPEHAGTLAIAFGGDKSPAVLQGAEAQILARLRATPGIQVAGMASVLPLGGADHTITFRIHGMSARFLMASHGYFAAMGIPLLQGRDFTPADDSLAPDVVVIDRAMADSLWPGLNPIGRLLPLGGSRHFTVVGVVGSVRETSLTQRPFGQMYFSIYQSTPSDVALVARSTLPGTVLLSRMQQAVHALLPSQPVYNVRMMGDVVSTSVAPQRTNTVLIDLFGVLALVLTTLGVYAVVSYSVAQRRRELGIRAALGAPAGALVTLVMREMVWVTVLGLGTGLAAAWAGARVVRSLLYGVEPHDPATYVLATLVLLVPVAITTFVPAHRAGRTNPAGAIRDE